MVDRNVTVTVRADVADFLRGAGLVEDATRKMADGAKRANQEAKTGLSGMAQHVRDNQSAYTTTGAALTAYGAAVTGLGVIVAKTGVEYNTLRQRSTSALTVMTGSAEDAADQMDRLDDFASNSPFARDVWIRAQQQLMGFGFEAQRVVPILDAVQQAVAATGGSNHDIAELVRIIAQIGASAKITATDLREFGNRGVDAATIIGEQMGMTGAEIRESITAGTLDADAAIRALTDGMSERFAGASEGIRGTFMGTLDRLAARFRDISAIMAEPLVSASGGGFLVDAGNKLADFLYDLQQLPGWVVQVGGALTGLSGLASLAAGGFLLLAPRLVETWDALSKMGRFGGAAQGALRGIGQAVAPTGVLIAGLTLIPALLNAIRDATNEAIPGIEGVGSALLDVAESGDIASLDRQIESLGIQVNGLSGVAEGPITDLDGAFRRLADPSIIQDLEWLDKVASFGQMRTSKDDVEDYFASLDGYLVQLATGGHAEQAAALLEHLWEVASGAGMDREEFEETFEGVHNALLGVENDARLAAEATEGLAEGINGEFVKIDPSILQGKAAEIREANEGIVQSFVNLGQDIGNTEISLDEWWAQIEEQFAAQEAWIDNIAYLRGEGMNEAFIQGLIAEGPAGAVRTQQIVDAVMGGETEWLKHADTYADHMHGGITQRLSESDPVVIAAEIQLEAQQAMEEYEELRSGLLRQDPVEIPLDADPEPLRQTVTDQILWALELDGVVKFDADGSLAHVRIDEWNARARETTGMPVLDANPERAKRQIAEYIADAANTTGVAILDANGNPADGTVDAWAWRAGRTEATATLNADASSANTTLANLVWRVRNTVASITLGAFGFGRAAGGPIYGPGTGTSDSIPASGPGGARYALSNNEHVLTAAEVAAAGGHGEIFRLRKALLAGTAHYDVGGPVGMPYASRFAMATAASPAPVLSIDYDRLGAATAAALAAAPIQLPINGRNLALATSEATAALGPARTWNDTPQPFGRGK